MIKTYYFRKFPLINHKKSLNLFDCVSKRYGTKVRKGDLGIVIGEKGWRKMCTHNYKA